MLKGEFSRTDSKVMERNRSLHDQLEISHYAQYGVVTTAVVLETLKLGRRKE